MAGTATNDAAVRTMAEQKIPEIDLLIARAQEMKNLLENGLKCGCLRPEDCAVILETTECRDDESGTV